MDDILIAVTKTSEQAAKWGKNRGFRCHEKLYRAYEELQRRENRTITDGLIAHMQEATGIKNTETGQ